MSSNSFEWFFAQRITFRNARAASVLVVRLSIISLMLAVATMEIALSVVQGFENEIQNKVVGFGSHIQISQFFGAADGEVRPLQRDEAAIDSIRQLPYVVSVSPFVERAALAKSKEGLLGIVMKGVGARYDWDFFRSCLREGALPAIQPGEESEQILVSRIQARELDLEVGDRALLVFIQEPVRRRRVTVSGIYETGLEEFDNHVMIGDIALLQGIWGWDSSEVSGFEVNLSSLDWLEAATTRINELTPFQIGAEPINDLYPEIFDWLSQQHQTVDFILGLMTLVAVINLCTMVLILIIERTRTIGILKALGLPNYRVQRVFVWNAAYLILFGVLAGNILGLGLLGLQDAFGFLRVSQESYFITTVPVAWVWERFLLVNLGVIVVWVTFMFIPTIIINRITPVQAIRFE